MSDFSRRHVLGSAAGGMLASLAAAEAAGQAQPPSGPAPKVLTGKELPSFRFPLGARAAKTWDGGWAKEATVAEFPVSEKIAGVLMQLAPGGLRELHWHTNAAEWAYVIAGAVPRHHHRSAGQIRDRGFWRGRRLVLPARLRPLDPGDRPRELPVRAGVRQRLFLRVRHLQHQRLDRSYAARGAGEELRRAGGDLREIPEGEVYIAKGAVPPALPADPGPDRSTAARLRTAIACWRKSRGSFAAAPTVWCRSGSFRSRRR